MSGGIGSDDTTNGRVNHVASAARCLIGVILLSVATAFLYNYVYLEAIEPRLLGAFGIADHIQTAVQAFLALVVAYFVAVFLAVIAMSGARLLSVLRPGPYQLFRLISICLVTLSVLQVGWRILTADAFIYWHPAYPVVGDILAIVAGLTLYFLPKIKQTTFQFRSIPLLLRDVMDDVRLRPVLPIILWLVGTSWCALLNAYAETVDPLEAQIDRVTLSKDVRLDGRVLRFIGQGLIFQRETGNVSFIPTSQIQHIDRLPGRPKKSSQRAENSYLVFFNWDNNNISEPARRTIKMAADAYYSLDSGRISLGGHDDTSRSIEESIAISLTRANILKDALIEEGIPPTAISVTAFGQSRLLQDTGIGIREPQNRRVVYLMNSP